MMWRSRLGHYTKFLVLLVFQIICQFLMGKTLAQSRRIYYLSWTYLKCILKSIFIIHNVLYSFLAAPMNNVEYYGKNMELQLKKINEGNKNQSISNFAGSNNGESFFISFVCEFRELLVSFRVFECFFLELGISANLGWFG